MGFNNDTCSSTLRKPSKGDQYANPMLRSDKDGYRQYWKQWKVTIKSKERDGSYLAILSNHFEKASATIR